MKLFFRKTGEGKPLIILHGLFGLSDNWNTLAKSFSENGFCCYVIDQRNHGKSPHSDVFSYEVMSDDLLEFMNDEKLEVADIIGHSMGGKTAMFFSLRYPEKIRKMIIVDMAPRYYPPHHDAVIAALKSIDTSLLSSRKEAEEQLRNSLSDEGTVQFLLKSLYWKEENQLDWRFGFREIEKNIEEMGKALPDGNPIQTQVLFLRGDRSGYIREEDEKDIKKRFENAEVKTISNAGHWVHAENPKMFFETAVGFLKK